MPVRSKYKTEEGYLKAIERERLRYHNKPGLKEQRKTVSVSWKKRMREEWKARDPEGYAKARRDEAAATRLNDPVGTWLRCASYTCNARARLYGRAYDKVKKAHLVAIYERDNKQCVDCGSTERLTIGHRIPLFYPVDGIDLNGEANLFIQCHTCNVKQHNAVHPSAGVWRLVKVG